MATVTPDRPSAALEAALFAPRLAVLIPCYNEQASVGEVVSSFRQILPDAVIFVCDNNSTDRTADLARAAGARVMYESLRGKGHALRRLFADVDADAYVLVDGDNTYDPSTAASMLNLLISRGLDIVTGVRETESAAAYRRGHRWGNRFLTLIVARIFGNYVSDMLSGYRAFSRRFVKSFPALSSGFEIETEFTVHALELDMPAGEVRTPYRERAQDNPSKLNTYRDGARIFFTILNLIRDQKPLQFFGLLAAASFFAGLGLSIPIFEEFYRTHLVPRFPTAFLSMGLVLLSAIFLVSGLVLDSVSRGRKELKRMTYLSIPRFWHQAFSVAPAAGSGERSFSGADPFGEP